MISFTTSKIKKIFTVWQNILIIPPSFHFSHSNEKLTPCCHYLVPWDQRHYPWEFEKSFGQHPKKRLGFSSGGSKEIGQNLDNAMEAKTVKTIKWAESGQKWPKIPLSCHYFELLSLLWVMLGRDFWSTSTVWLLACVQMLISWVWSGVLQNSKT